MGTRRPALHRSAENQCSSPCGGRWRGSASRILPKGAVGIAPYKPFHDDNNGVISLSFWTNLTQPPTPTNLVFLLNGHKVSLRATAHRFVLFMGYVPHETAPVDPSHTSWEPRVHHSAFAKPDAEHLAAHNLSCLPCAPGLGEWSMSKVHRLRGDAFSEENMQPIMPRAV